MKKILTILIAIILLATSLITYYYIQPKAEFHSPKIEFIVDKVNNTLTVKDINFNIHWENITLIGNAMLPSGLVKEGDFITNCTGIIKLFIGRPSKSLFDQIGEWYFIKSGVDFYFSNFLCLESVPGYLHSWEPETMGIKKIEWIDETSLLVNYYVSTICIPSIGNGSYRIENGTIFLQYEYLDGCTGTFCTCANELTYLIANLEEKEYKFSIEVIQNIPDIEFEADYFNETITVADIDYSADFDFNWSDIFASAYQNNATIPTGEINVGDVIYNCSEGLSILWSNCAFLFEYTTEVDDNIYLMGYLDYDGEVIVENIGDNPLSKYRVTVENENGEEIVNKTYDEAPNFWSTGEFRSVLEESIILNDDEKIHVRICNILEDGTEELVFYNLFY